MTSNKYNVSMFFNIVCTYKICLIYVYIDIHDICIYRMYIYIQLYTYISYIHTYHIYIHTLVGK